MLSLVFAITATAGFLKVALPFDRCFPSSLDTNCLLGKASLGGSMLVPAQAIRSLCLELFLGFKTFFQK